MFTGTEDNQISYQEAADLTANFRNAQEGSDYIKGEYFSKSSVQSILDQSNCVGVRIYYGIDDLGFPRLVLVGVTADENDMVNGVILDHGAMCPPECGVANDLNS